MLANSGHSTSFCGEPHSDSNSSSHTFSTRIISTYFNYIYIHSNSFNSLQHFSAPSNYLNSSPWDNALRHCHLPGQWLWQWCHGLGQRQHQFQQLWLAATHSAPMAEIPGIPEDSTRPKKAMTAARVTPCYIPFPKSGEKKGGPRMIRCPNLTGFWMLPFSDGVYEVSSGCSRALVEQISGRSEAKKKSP